MNKIKIAHIVCVVINVPITILTIITSCYPSLLGVSKSTSPQTEFAVRLASCVGSMISSIMASISLTYLHNQYVKIVDSNLPTQCSEVIEMDRLPSYSEVIEMNELPSYSDAVKISQSKCDSRTC
ncbi:hypothetical protein [Wolbachia endosymbiont of Pentalonia nigronervosa]|uniref:hypothetical protein n=1 Tax=Wolbachia endosymbiont of Pentalonia nigronervosa TaxID=1301914 RepID=UPI00165FB48D|nr:hypothetical protein [Wolbachia endosymbiont of Pentalonia nigronervosa]